jgi:hypothetical protein
MKGINYLEEKWFLLLDDEKNEVKSVGAIDETAEHPSHRGEKVLMGFFFLSLFTSLHFTIPFLYIPCLTPFFPS